MSATQKRAPSLQALFILVMILMVPTLWSWFTPPRSNESLVEKATRTSRGIASVQDPSVAREVQSGRLSRPVTLQWDLGKIGLKKEVEATHLRLTGRLLGLKPDKITNTTNGFTAAVFTQGTGFSTDFIELKEGANQIQVEYQDAEGKTATKTLEINRRGIASVH